MKTDISDLERIATRCKDLVICEVKKCQLKGDYWKCYMGNYTKCSIYQDYKNKIERK